MYRSCASTVIYAQGTCAELAQFAVLCPSFNALTCASLAQGALHGMRTTCNAKGDLTKVSPLAQRASPEYDDS